MENLFGTIGRKDPRYLLASNYDANAIAVSVEPGHGIIPAGAVLYRKSGSVLYAPAAAANIVTTNNLVVLRDDVDTTTNAAIAMAAAAYRRAMFIAGKVLKADGNDGYEPISAAEAIVLRMQGLELSPMDDLSADSPTEADNRLALAVTVTAGTGGTATADKQTAKKGETVTITITPSSNKELDEIECTAGDVTLNVAADGSSATFVMGEKAVTITVSFKAST